MRKNLDFEFSSVTTRFSVYVIGGWLCDFDYPIVHGNARIIPAGFKLAGKHLICEPEPPLSRYLFQDGGLKTVVSN